MPRTTAHVLSLAALLAVPAVAPMPATAAGETCQGRPATLVGTTGQPLAGTDGADVLVSGGASRVDALGGDDLVCVTGDARSVPQRLRTVVVVAGAGDDRVEVTTPGWGSLALLGPGADSYLGSSGAAQEVRSDDVPFTVDTAVDLIEITSGEATVYSGSDSRPNSDVVEIESGVVQWTGVMTPAGRLSGGPGATLRTAPLRGDATIDAAARTAVTDTSLARWSGFGRLAYRTFAAQGIVTFRGSAGTDDLSVEARGTYDRVIDMRGGADHYSSDDFGGPRSSFDGGAGRDHLTLGAHRQRVDADLDTGRFVAREGRRTVRRTFDGFERLDLAARRATVDGTPRRDHIVLVACRAHVSADGGRDVVDLGGRLAEWDDPGCSSRRGSIDGGRGADVLSGSRGRDRIVGGPGRDRADGGRGRDTCRGRDSDQLRGPSLTAGVRGRL